MCFTSNDIYSGSTADGMVAMDLSSFASRLASHPEPWLPWPTLTSRAPWRIWTEATASRPGLSRTVSRSVSICLEDPGPKDTENVRVDWTLLDPLGWFDATDVLSLHSELLISTHLERLHGQVSRCFKRRNIRNSQNVRLHENRYNSIYVKQKL